LLTKELQGLGLDVELLNESGQVEDYSKSLDIYNETEQPAGLGIDNLAPITSFLNTDNNDENF
jgi:hypothetical protein